MFEVPMDTAGGGSAGRRQGKTRLLYSRWKYISILA
jgi:hypothetical protein